MLLVGDTLGMVVQGHNSTIPVTLDHIIYHASIVTRVTERALIVGDMPFMTYGISIEQTLRHAARLMQESSVSAVKLEGGESMAPTIARIVQSGIPVMAHIGLTPQSINQIGGFRVQGKEVESARKLIRDAEAVETAGAFAVVLELVPDELSQIISEKLHIPTIGIGAGVHCDGQVQVFHDILGLFADFVPRHTRVYAPLGQAIKDAITHYIDEVKQHDFPTEAHSSSLKADVLAALREDK